MGKKLGQRDSYYKLYCHLADAKEEARQAFVKKITSTNRCSILDVSVEITNIEAKERQIYISVQAKFHVDLDDRDWLRSNLGDSRVKIEDEHYDERLEKTRTFVVVGPFRYDLKKGAFASSKLEELDRNATELPAGE